MGNMVTDGVNEIVGRVAEDLPQYFQLRRPRMLSVSRMTVGSDVGSGSGVR